MNITLGVNKAVHMLNPDTDRPMCGGLPGNTPSMYFETDRDVTCKKCLKLEASKKAAADRTAYYAGLSDAQDTDLSQAVNTEETPVTCCEHAPMYHGARGCDSCGCNTPRNASRPQAAPTVGRTIYTDGDNVPSYARLVSVTEMAWIPGMRRSTVTVAQHENANFGTMFWVYAESGLGLASLLYRGTSRTAADVARRTCVENHAAQVRIMSFNAEGVQVATPTESVLTVYIPQQDVPVREPRWLADAPETDPFTGFPVITVKGRRYVVDAGPGKQFGSTDFIDYWLADGGPGSRNVHKAYADAPDDSIALAIWEALHPYED